MDDDDEDEGSNFSTFFGAAFIVSLVLAGFGFFPVWGVICVFFWSWFLVVIGLFLSGPLLDFFHDLASSKRLYEMHYHSLWKFRYRDDFRGKIIEDPAVKEARKREAEQKRREAEQKRLWEERQKARQAQNAGPFPKDPWWGKSFTADDLQRLNKLRSRLTVKSLSRFPLRRYSGSGPYLPDAAPNAGLFRFPN
jgi:hypothetical protein